MAPKRDREQDESVAAQRKRQRPDHSAGIYPRLAGELQIGLQQVQAAVSLLQEGCTVPFIARYRKEATQNLSDIQLRMLVKKLATAESLGQRRQAVLAQLKNLGVLTRQVEHAVNNASSLTALEDLYQPYKQKKGTKAAAALAKGLGPLADALLSGKPALHPDALADMYSQAVKDAPQQAKPAARADALKEVQCIIAERATDVAEAREAARRQARAYGSLTSSRKAVKASQKQADANSGRQDAETYELYFDFNCTIRQLKPHQVLAINRGESRGVLAISLLWDTQLAAASCLRGVLHQHGSSESGHPPAHLRLVKQAIQEGVAKRLKGIIDRELRAELTETATQQALDTFARNLHKLLLAPPLRDTVILGIDPAYRTGCKCAVIDATGAIKATAVLYPHPPAAPEKRKHAPGMLQGLIKQHAVRAVAIGNGTAAQETQAFVAEILSDYNKANQGPRESHVSWCIVNEAGASIYSASELASKELPDLDVTLRGAVSIARRLADPLAELIKVEPQHIGVGLYQHDMKAPRLNEELRGTVEAAVNSVGVELNSASAALLSYVAGLNRAVGQQLVEHRTKAGPFKSRAQLLKVKGLGPKTFQQAAGFLRVAAAANALDNTAVHPESYPAAAALVRAALQEQCMEAANQAKAARPTGSKTAPTKASAAESCSPADLEQAKPRLQAWCQSTPEQQAALAQQVGLGALTLRDMLEALCMPGRDVRTEAAPPPMRTTAAGWLADLRVGMELDGVVRNVVSYGAFVDCNVQRDGLLHISAYKQAHGSKGQDMQECLGVGDAIRVRVVSVDTQKGRYGLASVWQDA
ncbi:hypothetical protein WJX72_010221 [[Myrmecia] bisecta]|uniref:S1 motif domain-containing protein n=1 Tax=[Myrmecia] bisecta TaxID=41462 RepID=A0AAW1QSI2_9CHLO